VYGISSGGKEAISRIVEDLFDKIAVQFLGSVPKLSHKKTIFFNVKTGVSLANLFLEAMNNRSPNIFEQDALKSMLDSAYGYIDSLKSKTKSNVVEKVDGLVKEAKAKGLPLSQSEIDAAIKDELRKAKSQMKAIAESESTKFRNVGAMMDITKVAASQGDDDPLVFFVVVKDGATCKECMKLHLHPDGTPRVWRFSELKQGYHKRGESFPSAFGLHPHCRCTLTYLAKGWGFKKGHVSYVGHGHDEFARQRG
jgi:hypothetical protein